MGNYQNFVASEFFWSETWQTSRDQQMLFDVQKKSQDSKVQDVGLIIEYPKRPSMLLLRKCHSINLLKNTIFGMLMSFFLQWCFRPSNQLLRSCSTKKKLQRIPCKDEVNLIAIEAMNNPSPNHAIPQVIQWSVPDQSAPKDVEAVVISPPAQVCGQWTFDSSWQYPISTVRWVRYFRTDFFSNRNGNANLSMEL